MSTEEWRPVIGHHPYMVSSHGRVRGLKGQLMKGIPNKGGRRAIRLGGRCGPRRYIHQLVLEAFVGPAGPGQECLHANDVASDNRVENLRWGTRTENLYDAVRNGKHRGATKDKCAQGHDFTPENTYIRKKTNGNTQRGCRLCARAAEASYYRRKKGA